MKSRLICFRAASLIVMCVLCNAGADTFVYRDLSALTKLIFQADATLSKDGLRLTPAARAKVGGVWLHEKQLVRDGFETTFQLRITEPRTYGADGMAFVIQNNRTPSLGQGGYNIGFGGITNSLVIKFDNYHWQGKTYVKYDEVAVTTCDASTAKLGGTNSLGSATNGVVFSDGKVHILKISYVPGTMSIYLDNPNIPVIAVPLILENMIDLDQGSAWVGFTAATGDDYQNHDILNWTFNLAGSAKRPRANEPSVPAAGISSGAKTNGNSQSVAGASPTVTELSVGRGGTPGFGPFQYKLPESVRLTHEVFASTDLVNWTPVTNLTLYFSDLHSTNYDYRFYIFREK